jgi:hypothetical protein
MEEGRAPLPVSLFNAGTVPKQMTICSWARAMHKLRLVEDCKLLFLELEAGLVFFEEFAEVLGDVEEADPLFVIEGDGEAA